MLTRELEVSMVTRVVTYSLNDGTAAEFEIDPGPGYVPAAGRGEIIAAVRDAVSPAVEAAREVLDRMKPLSSDTVTVRFGVKVNGDATWSIARAVGEGNFEVTLSWRP
jgi:hypothetical protein